MRKKTAPGKAAGEGRVGEEVIASLREAVAWAGGENIPVRLTKVEVRATDLRALRKRLRLSQSAFAARFGFQPATLRNWETGPNAPGRPGARAAGCDRTPSGCGCRRIARGRVVRLARFDLFSEAPLF
jgi:putative transcriptional regulator